MAVASCSLLAFAFASVPQGPPAPECRIVAANHSDEPRREIVRVSLPMPCGTVRGPTTASVAGTAVPAIPLVTWPDGSAAVLQLHVPLELEAHEERRLHVQVGGPPPAPAPASPASWKLDGELPLHTEVEDAWGQVYTARLVPDPEPSPPSSDLVRVRRYTGVHRRGAAELLGVVAWLVAFRGEPRAELTVVLDNGAYLPREPGLGPVRLRAFTLVTTDERLRFRPRFTAENAIAAALPSDGGYRQPLLGPSDQIHLGDRTAKAFRLDVLLDDGSLDAGARAAAASGEWIVAWPDLDWVRHTGAFGAHGGPAPATRDESRARWLAWRSSGRFGPFRGHGDPEDAAEQGTPRNGTCALHDALRWYSAPLLRAAETMVLQQALRPTAGFAPRQPPQLAPFRAGLSPRAVERPHGFTALDYEHFSVDLVYDAYWLTGDPFARAELERAAIGLRRTLAGVPFLTSRGEGWCLQAGVLIARATGDGALVQELLQRARTKILPRLGDPPHLALAQPPHPDAFGIGEAFDAPWQMAALVYGLDALHRETGDAEIAAAAVQVARIMAGPGWAEGEGPKYLVSARSADRYTMPVGYQPMQGTACHEASAFVLAAELATESEDRRLFTRRAAEIAAANGLPENAAAASDTWWQIYLDRTAREQ